MKPKAPMSVIVLCVFVGLMALVNLCSSPFAMLPYVVDLGVPNPALDAIRGDPILYPVMIASLGIGLVLSVVALISCVGAVLLRSWGRLGLLAYAALSLVMWAVGLVTNLMVTFPRLTESGDPGMAVGAYVGGILGSCFGLVIPVAILVVMMLPSVREAFRGAGDAASA